MRDIYFKVNYGIFDLISCVFVIWILNPMSHEYYNPINICLIAVIWMVFAYVDDRKSFAKALCSRAFFVSLIYPIIMILYTLLGERRFGKSCLGAPILVLFYMYFCYRHDKKNKAICHMGIIYIFLISVYTLVQLNGNNNIARLLANGDREAKAELVSPFTAGFFEVYAYIFLTIVIVKAFLIIKDKKFQMRYIFLLACLIALFIRAQYTIAILLLVSGIFLGQLEKKNIWTFLTLFTVVLIILAGLVKVNIWGDFVYTISKGVPEGILRNRVIQIGDLLSSRTPKFLTNGAVTRFDLYEESWKTFMQYPLFGVGDSRDAFSKQLIGGHSTFLDYLAEYGIFGGGIYIITTIYVLLKVSHTLPRKWRYIYRINIYVYIALSVLNTTHRNNILMMLVVFIPIYIKYIDEKYNLKCCI